MFVRTDCSNFSPLSFSLGSTPLKPFTKVTKDHTLQIKWLSLSLTWPTSLLITVGFSLKHFLLLAFGVLHVPALYSTCLAVMSWSRLLFHPHLLDFQILECPRAQSWNLFFGSIYTHSLADLIQPRDFQNDLNSSDSHISLCSLDLFPERQTHVSYYLRGISMWLSNRHLKLHTSNTELLVLPQNPLACFLVSFNGNSILVVDQVKNLGSSLVLFLFHMSDPSINPIINLYFYNKSTNLITNLVHATVISHLDRSSSLLSSCPASACVPGSQWPC